tara:strand:- start:151 stop:780 length:630 start_codon:yes stop_codon:yes gene_type:complete
MSEERTRFSAPATIKVDELIHIYDGILPAVDEILADKEITTELPQPRPPMGIQDYVVEADNGDPVLPDDLTVLGDKEIGKLFSFFTNWTNYIQGLLTQAECARDVIKSKVATLEKALIITYQEEDVSLSDTKAKAKIRLDRRFVEAEASYQKSVVLARRLHTRFDQLKRSEKVISREQTRRQTELEALAHEQRGGRGAFPRTRGRRKFS